MKTHPTPPSDIEPPTAAHADALIPSPAASVQLSVFEGPLDLLLFLIRKNELDIYDIPIETVTGQYLDILYGADQLDIEAAGDFFVMAATLMHIKSRMLLPIDPAESDIEGEDEGIDPRWELVEQLLEYKKFKEAAENLKDIMSEARDLLPRHHSRTAPDRAQRSLGTTDKIELWNTFNRVLRRLSDKITIGHLHSETVTVSERMEYILHSIKTRPNFLFSSLFDNRPFSMASIIATFLAILELVRLKQISIQQDSSYADIRCEAVQPPTTPAQTE